MATDLCRVQLHDDAAPAADPAVEPVLSARLAVLRSGLHLAEIANRLRAQEAMLIAAEGEDAPSEEALRRARRARLQAMDLILQELMGLSGLLVGAAPQVGDVPDPVVDALVDVPRLQSLSQALRHPADLARAPAPGIVLF